MIKCKIIILICGVMYVCVFSLIYDIFRVNYDYGIVNVCIVSF